VYSWLTNPNAFISDENYLFNSVIIIENFFENFINNKWWKTHHDFFIKLYKLIFLIANADNRTSSFFLKKKIANLNTNSENLLFLLNNKISLTNFSYFFFWLTLRANNNYFYFKNKNNPFRANNFINNLSNFNIELINHVNLLSFKIGYFYFSNISQANINYLLSQYVEFSPLTSLLLLQNKTSKWNRWLYKYSILHRKIIKNSHKLTLTKKLLNSTFYDNSFFKKNLWNSEHLTKYSNSTLPISTTLQTYFNTSDYLIKNNYLNSSVNNGNNDKQQKNLTFLSLQQNSYFWFLKRFFFFNKMSTNFLTSKNQYFDKLIKNKSEKNYFEKNFTFFKHFPLINYTFNSLYFTHKNFIFEEKITFTKTSNYFNFSNFNQTFPKEFLLIFNDNDLLSITNSKLLLTLSANNTYINNSWSFYNYCSFSNALSAKPTKIAFSFIKQPINKNKSLFFNSNYYLNYPLLSLENRYIRDLKYFFFFN
jgi:hypothetical protein